VAGHNPVLGGRCTFVSLNFTLVYFLLYTHTDLHLTTYVYIGNGGWGGWERRGFSVENERLIVEEEAMLLEVIRKHPSLNRIALHFTNDERRKTQKCFVDVRG